MNLAAFIAKYFFYLAALLIIVVYFVGFSTNVNTAGNVLNKLGNTFTGRNAQGNFAGYPQSPSVPGK